MLSNEHVLDRREVHAGFEARFLSALRSSESKSIVHQMEWHLSRMWCLMNAGGMTYAAGAFSKVTVVPMHADKAASHSEAS